MAKKTVLLFAHAHPSVQAGGAEQYAYELCRALRSSDEFDAVLVARVGPPPGREAGTPHPGTRLGGVDGDPGQVLLYTHPDEFDTLNLSLRSKGLYEDTVRELIEAYDPAVVHFQHTLLLGVELVRFVRSVRPRAPILYTLHEFWPICHHDGKLYRTGGRGPCPGATPARCHDCFPDIPATAFHLRKRFIQSHLAAVDRFIAPSEFLLDRFAEWGVPREKLVYEEYGRPVPGPPPVDAPVTRPRNRFGFFGQVNAYKGLDVLLGAFARLPDRGADGPRLSVHGANLDRQPADVQDRFRGLLAAAGPAVTFAGAYPHGEVGRLMRAVDWVVVPSVWGENSPLVIQEAFMAGRPVLCGDIGGMREKVRDGVDGLHFRAGDPAELAAAVARACDTPGLWDQLRAGIRPVYGMGEHVARLTDLYRSLLAAPRG